jgi:hypothetical protein
MTLPSTLRAARPMITENLDPLRVDVGMHTAHPYVV